MSIAEFIDNVRGKATDRWPAEIDAFIIHLILDGASSLETARLINRAFPNRPPCTRNSVIGRCERLGVKRASDSARATRVAHIKARNRLKLAAFEGAARPAPYLPPIPVPAPVACGPEMDTPRWPRHIGVALAAMASQGLHAAEIADRLNKMFPDIVPFSRDAVVGRCRLVGISIRTEPRKRVLTPPTMAHDDLDNTPVEIDETVEKIAGVRLDELQSWHCRWPLGDPYHDDFRFCGCQKERGSYCAKHAKLAYVASPVRRARAHVPHFSLPPAFDHKDNIATATTAEVLS